MAVGASYPAVVTDANGNETTGEVLTFTDASNQPLGLTGGSELPTADPHVVGSLWADSGVVTVSAG